MDIIQAECAACQETTKCVRIPIKPWWKMGSLAAPYRVVQIPRQDGTFEDQEVHLCEPCLTTAMLNIRPFSVVPAVNLS